MLKCIRPVFVLIDVFDNKSRLKDEKSLSAEMEIVFTELLLLGGMKQALRNARRSAAALRYFQIQKQSRFLQL